VTIPIYATGAAVGPRQPDGSLPAIDFLKLAPGSHLIDAGVDVGLPYNGPAPDLGWFESGTAAPVLPGDYNADNSVDALDYLVWRQAKGTATTLPNDSTPGNVDETDYTEWRSHFGIRLGAGAFGIGSAVPEPSTLISLTAVVALFSLIKRTPVRCGGDSQAANRNDFLNSAL
jgi:hypothetical protein